MAESTETNTSRSQQKRRKPRPGDPITMPVWLFYPLSLGSLVAAVLLYRRGDPVTAVTVVVIALSGWTGFRMGFGRIAISLIAFVAAIRYAPSLGMKYENAFSQQFGATGLTNRFLCIAAIGVLISLVATIGISFLGNRLLGKRRTLKWANSFAGFAIGLIEGVAMCFLVLGGLLSLQMWQRDDDIQNNVVATSVDRWASRTRQSAIGPIIRDYNPFERIDLLASTGDFHKTLRRFNDPANLQRLLDDPRIADLRSDPSVAAAIDEILRDPKIKELIDQKRPVDRQMLLRLMSSPAVLRLADHPEFIPKARQAISDL